MSWRRAAPASRSWKRGPWVRTRQFSERVYDAFRRMFRDAGMQVIEGRAYIPLLQGRCVGGSTVMNSAIAHRTPEDVLDEWRGFWSRHIDHGQGPRTAPSTRSSATSGARAGR